MMPDEAGIRAGLPIYKVYESLIFADIRNACDILRPVYESSNRLMVTCWKCQQSPMILRQQLKKPDATTKVRIMVKIPGTKAGLQQLSR